MKLRLQICVLAMLAPLVAFADITNTDNKQHVPVDCAKDPIVTIAGNYNHVEISGACKRLRVVGNGNDVTAASAIAVTVDGNENTVAVTLVDALSATGNKNHISFKKAVTAGKQPAVSNLGSDNQIARDTAK